MPKKTKEVQTEFNIFLDAIEGVKPLYHNKVRLASRKLKTKQKKLTNRDKSHPLIELELIDLPPPHPVTSDEPISYKQDALANKILRNLSKGKYNVEASLDLHGLRVKDAKNAIVAFVSECLQRDIQVALIIHGKGKQNQMPALKNKLNQWLREIDMVLAFSSALPSHGGCGAMYVLFKRRIGENFA